MLIDEGSGDYTYIHSTEGVPAKRIKHMTYSYRQRAYDESKNGDEVVLEMSTCIGIIVGLQVVVAVCFAEFIAASILFAATALLMSPLGLRIKRAVQYRRLSLDRSRMIVIEEGRATNSFAYEAIMSTEFGQKVLRPELMRHSITRSWKRKKYLRYIDTNPDNQLFPKLKREFDGFLARTTEHDVALAKFGKIASDGEIKRLKAEVDQFVADNVKRMQAIMNEHNALIETDRQMALEEKRRIADMELQQITPLTTYKELLQPL